MDLLLHLGTDHQSGLQSELAFGQVPDQILSLEQSLHVNLWLNQEFSSLKAGSAPVLVNLENGLINPNTSISRAFLTGYNAKSGSEIFIRAFDKSISANRL